MLLNSPRSFGEKRLVYGMKMDMIDESQLDIRNEHSMISTERELVDDL